jgi:putative oxidoreductase
MNGYLQPLARLLMALIFLLSGFTKIANFGGTVGMLGHLGWPAPALFITLAILIELIGGLCLLFGFRTRMAALALVVFMIAATIGVHGVLLSTAPDQQAKQEQMVNILKNIAITGGLLKFFTDGAGRYAIDRERAA